VKSRDSHELLRAFLWARLALAAGLLLLFPLLPPDLVPGTSAPSVTIALLAVVLSAGAVLVVPGGRPRRLAWLIGLLDVVLVTAVVAATGGARSIFTFLYVLSVIAACVLLSRAGGLVIGALSSALYSGLVLGRVVFPLAAFWEAPTDATGVEVLTMFVNAATFLVVAIVAGGLAERSRSASLELETKQRALRDLQAFKDLIFHSVSAGLIAVDRGRLITAFNRAAEDITGWAAGAAIGREWSAVFAATVPLDAVEQALAERPSTRHETSVRRPDGAAVPVRMTFSALRSGDDQRLGVICVCEDLSTIRAMEARVRHADRLASLGRMSANIAHEIRNPLASLTGAIEALAGNLASADARDRLARIVLRESERLNQIIKDFLEYARPAPLAVRAVNVAEILDEVLVLLEHRARPGTLKLVREFPPSLPWEVDPQQFRQALWNLCLNALEAMPDGGELRIGAAAERDHLEIRVTDMGEGIAPNELFHVFEPFYSTKASGSGLGLALVHRIIQDHGGDIDVRSAPGFGTTFTMTLPPRHA
jgi:two-component system sensor histidine kinase PilS (NtrC family)